MTDVNYYVGRERIRDLMREAENEREAKQHIRNNRQSQPQPSWIRRVLGNPNTRTQTGERN